MVVLTIVAQNNGETVYFDEPLSKVHFIKLVSCSLYNSWHNLPTPGSIYIKNETKDVVAKILPGFYTVDVLAKELTTSVKALNKIQNFKIEANKPNSVLKFSHPNNFTLGFDGDLDRFIGIDAMKFELYVKKLNCPSTYFIHCDLLDKTQNLLNNNKSDLLATFDVKGKPYEKVSYDASPQQPLRDCSTDSHVNSINLSVRNQQGELFDFNGMPLKFELEIN